MFTAIYSPVTPLPQKCARGPLFPCKLWAAANESRGLIEWSIDGRSIVVDDNESEFEASIQRTYPTLVDIPTFANFRRQLREYGFSWSYNAETKEFSFSHPSFIRGRPDLLHDVNTRRVSFRLAHNGQTMKLRGLAAIGTYYSARSRRVNQSPMKPRLKSSWTSTDGPLRVSPWTASRRSSTAADPGGILGKLSQANSESANGDSTCTTSAINDRPREVSRLGGQTPSSSSNGGAFAKRQQEVTTMNFKQLGRRFGVSDKDEWWTHCLPWILEEIGNEARRVSADGGQSGSGEVPVVDVPVYFDGSHHQATDFDGAAVVSELPLPPGKLLHFVEGLNGSWICREITEFDEC